MSTDTRDVRIVTVSQLQPGDVVVTWEDDGFPWTGEIESVEKVARGDYSGNVTTGYRVHYAGQPANFRTDPADKPVKIRNEKKG